MRAQIANLEMVLLSMTYTENDNRSDGSTSVGLALSVVVLQTEHDCQ